jgi:hypothetical protein
MKFDAKLLALSALAALAACEGGADDNLAATAEQGVESLGDDIANVAEDAANTASEVGAAVENGAEAAADELSGDNDAGNASDRNQN